MSRCTPTDVDLKTAREIMSHCSKQPDADVYYLLGMLRSWLGLEADWVEVPAEQMVRQARAAILVYDERQ